MLENSSLIETCLYLIFSSEIALEEYNCNSTPNLGFLRFKFRNKTVGKVKNRKSVVENYSNGPSKVFSINGLCKGGYVDLALTKV